MSDYISREAALADFEACNAESNDSYYCRLCGAKMDGGNGA